MGKKNSGEKNEKKKSAGRKKSRNDGPTGDDDEERRIVTMEALDEVSISDDDGKELPPVDEWDADALALKQSIDTGAFDKLLRKLKNETSQGGDDESIEEVDLDAEDEGERDLHDSSGENDDKKAGGKHNSAKGGDERSSSSNRSGTEASESESEEEEPMETSGKALPDDASSDSHNSNDEKEEDDDDDGDDSDNELKKKNSLNSKALGIVTEGLRAEKKGWAWAETFDILSYRPLPFRRRAREGEEHVDIHDDLKREVAFYDMALEAVTEARSKCKYAGIPFQRPDDFFADMVKTDGTPSACSRCYYLPTFYCPISHVRNCFYFHRLQITWPRLRTG